MPVWCLWLLWELVVLEEEERLVVLEEEVEVGWERYSKMRASDIFGFGFGLVWY